MQHFTYIFLISFLISSCFSVDFTCPTGPITKDKLKGSFPSVDNAVFPANYSCTVDFTIPDGWVIHFTVKTNVTADSKDSFIIRDSASVLNKFSVGTFDYIAPANISTVLISTKKKHSNFYFTWEFQDKSNYTKQQYNVGTVLKLAALPASQYFVFTSPSGQVTLNTANLKRADDLKTSTVYVYDGDSINSKYIGTLLQFISNDVRQKSTGKSLTLVNFYNYDTDSYLIANNYADIVKYSAYNFLLLTKANGLTGNIRALTAVGSAFTFYSVDDSGTYMTTLDIVDKGSSDAQVVRFHPLTPSDNKDFLLSYDAKGDNANQIPQQVAGNLFTVVATNVQFSFSLSSDGYSTWLIPYAGRSGSIISPSLWNPTASPKYSAQFSSNNILTYVFNFDKVTISQPQTEAIRVEVGSPGATPAVVQFTNSVSNPGTRVANGTYMTTTFNGTNPKSSFIVSFLIKDPNPQTTTTKKITSAPRIETTTKSSVSLFSFSLMTVMFLSKIVVMG